MTRVALLTMSDIPGYEGSIIIKRAPVASMVMEETFVKAAEAAQNKLRKLAIAADGNAVLGVGFTQSVTVLGVYMMIFGTVVHLDPPLEIEAD